MLNVMFYAVISSYILRVCTYPALVAILVKGNFNWKPIAQYVYLALCKFVMYVIIN